jgi:hypothetical protein
MFQVRLFDCRDLNSVNLGLERVIFSWLLHKFLSIAKNANVSTGLKRELGYKPKAAENSHVIPQVILV